MAIFMGKILVYQAGYHMVLGFVIYATELIHLSPHDLKQILTGHLQRRLPLGQDIFRATSLSGVSRGIGS